MFQSIVRLTLVCLSPRCGLRQLSIPRETWQRMHGVDCDRCGLPMECIRVSGGRDPLGDAVIWSDVPYHKVSMNANGDATITKTGVTPLPLCDPELVH